MAVATSDPQSSFRSLTSTRGMTIDQRSATAAREASTTNSSNGTSSGSEASTGNSAGNALSANYNMFLKILTTQLRTQNPLEPTDADKFTQQLTQYSSVEQQIQTNDNLKSMLASIVSGTALSLVNYIGKTVQAAATVTKLADGKATWTLNSSKAATDAEVVIKNEAGAVVYQGKTDLKKGDNSYSWDGKLSNGTTAPDGNYKIEITAKDADGKAVTVESKVTGKVTAVDTSGNEPFLKINGQMIPLSGLLMISE